MNNNKQRDSDHPVALEIRDETVWVTLRDGRIIGTPLNWYPWLAQASAEQRANFELHAFSIYWPDLDDGLDIQALVTGHWTTPMDAAVEEARH